MREIIFTLKEKRGRHFNGIPMYQFELDGMEGMKMERSGYTIRGSVDHTKAADQWGLVVDVYPCEKSTRVNLEVNCPYHRGGFFCKKWTRVFKGSDHTIQAILWAEEIVTRFHKKHILGVRAANRQVQDQDPAQAASQIQAQDNIQDSATDQDRNQEAPVQAADLCSVDLIRRLGDMRSATLNQFTNEQAKGEAANTNRLQAFRGSMSGLDDAIWLIKKMAQEVMA